MRTIEKGILGIGILLAMLVLATGSASAEGMCVVNETLAYECGDTVEYSCTLNATMDCSGTIGHGLIVGADGITIDGADFAIVGPRCADTYIAGIYNCKHDNVIIKNLEVQGFCDGIRLKGIYDPDMEICTNKVENNIIDNCEVHDNGASDKKYHGIELKPCVCNSTITNCEVYNQTGKKEGSCEDGGAGIRLRTKSNHNNITNNVIYNNSLAGIYSKKACMHNYVADNEVYENGEIVAVSYFGGGIRLQCKKTNFWTVENNKVTDNFGPGIFVRGDNNVIRFNSESGSKNVSSVAAGYGMHLSSDANNNNVTANRFCDNEGTNIRNDGVGTIGDENCCDTTYNYDDAGTTGCTYCCGSDLVITDIWIESGKSCTDGKEIEEKELEEFMHEKGMEKEQKELKQLIDELGISMEDIDSIDDKCIWGRKVYYEVVNMGCQEWAGWSVSNLTVDGEFKMFDLVRPLAPKQSRVERFWFYRLPGGEHEVEVCADFLNWVSECNETNNCLTKTLGG